MSANAEETAAQTRVVARNSELVNKNLQTVAVGTEQMGASITEIAKNATEAAKIATSAVKVAETTTITIAKLGESSTEIGQVIKVTLRLRNRPTCWRLTPPLKRHAQARPAKALRWWP